MSKKSIRNLNEFKKKLKIPIFTQNENNLDESKNYFKTFNNNETSDINFIQQNSISLSDSNENDLRN